MFRQIAGSLSRHVSRTFAADAPTVRGFLTSTRTLAAKEAAEPKVTVPLKQYGVDGRYSEALYVAAMKAGKADKVEAELAKANAMLNADDTLTAIVNDPTMARKKKEAVIMHVMKENKFDDLVVNLFGILSKNGRTPECFAVEQSYKKLMYASRNEVECTVTTAVALTDAEKADAKQRCIKELPKGAKVTLKTVVDPSIQGGWKLAIGDSFFLDYTAQTRMQKIETRLRKVLYET